MKTKNSDLWKENLDARLYVLQHVSIKVQDTYSKAICLVTNLKKDTYEKLESIKSIEDIKNNLKSILSEIDRLLANQQLK